MRRTHSGRIQSSVMCDVSNPLQITTCTGNRRLLDVFCKDPPRPDVVNDSQHFWPQVDCNASASSSRAKWLARKSACDAIHASGVVGWIEQPDVLLVHAQVWEPSVGGALSKDGATVGIDLDGADRSMPEDAVCEQSASSSGEEMQSVNWHCLSSI
jgi:hypothetical protein